MSNDSRYVLAQLTKSGLWSNWDNLLRFKHLVVDADSLLTHLYNHCQAQHLARQRNLAAALKLPRHLAPDYYSATLINYQELGGLIERVFGCLEQRFKLQPLVVYRGKYMEAPLFGLGPAQYKKNSQRVSEALLALVELEAAEVAREACARETRVQTQDASQSKGGASRGDTCKLLRRRYAKLEASLSRLRPTRPNLALNLFKQIVNARAAKRLDRSRPAQHQAFYSPYPTMARLARDFKCPVLTNDGDFVIMDVRAGFVLFEDFFQDLVLGEGNSLLRHPSDSASLNLSASIKSLSPSPRGRALRPTSTSSASSMARNQLVGVASSRRASSASSASSASGAGGAGGAKISPARRGPAARSPAMHVTSSRSLFQQDGPAGGPAGGPPVQRQVRARFHHHKMFLRQHPGLNPALALQLFPLTSGEFLLNHSKSLIRFNIYDREFQERDLMVATSEQHSFKKFHMAAGRLETVLRFLCTKEPNILVGLMHGEAARLHQPAIETDYNQLYNYYAVSYHFKGRLRWVLKQLAGGQPLSLAQLAHLESSLLARECSADFWLSLFVCSFGRMAACDYNKALQFEDLKARHSARSMLDRPKTLLMSLMSANKHPKGEHSPSLSDRQRRSLEAKFPTASLTVVDRLAGELAERSLGTNKFPAAPTAPANGAALALQELRAKLPQLATGGPTPRAPDVRRAACAFINLTFNSRDMTQLQFSKLEAQLAKWQPQQATGAKAKLADAANSPPSQRDAFIRQLAVLLALHKFSLEQAMQEDQYFKQNYLALSHHFEIGLVNHHLYLVYLAATSAGANAASTAIEQDLKQLVDLVHRHDLEQVANLSFPLSKEQQEAQLRQRTSVVVAKSLKSPTSATKAVKGPQAVRRAATSERNQFRDSALKQTTGELRRRIRHLLELLSSSLEAYCELNAFFNYPMPQLQLGQCFNPILLYNLTLFSCEQPINTQLVKF